MKNFNKLAVALAQIAYDRKCDDIVVLNVKKMTALCDFFVIATVKSQNHVNSLRDLIDDYCEQNNYRKPPQPRNASPSWQVLDYIGVIVHLMSPETREFYGLERLWHKAKKVEWHDKTGNKKRAERKA